MTNLEDIKDIEEMSIFMVATEINRKAFCEMPKGYYVRNLKRTEIDFWKAMPFDNDYKNEYKKFMDDYYDNVYKSRENEFYNVCKVVCNEKDEIVSTCFLWKIFDNITSVQWFKTLNEYEGKKLGRALLSTLFKDLQKKDFPIILHTQAGSYKAIKLYSDFGFKIITNDMVGNRVNQIKLCQNYLKQVMPNNFYNDLKYIELDNDFLSKIGNEDIF